MPSPSPDDRPLHVRVAEALGWTDCELGWVFGSQRWCGTNPARQGGFDGCGRLEIPYFDTNWHATGPLIEQYGISLYKQEYGWEAGRFGYADVSTRPLVTVCNVILALALFGKLEEAQSHAR